MRTKWSIIPFILVTDNILAVIVGYSELISLNLSADSSVRKYAEEIRHASNRAAGLTRQLLVFSRKQLVQLHVIDPNDAVNDLEALLRRLIDNNVSGHSNPATKGRN